MDVDHILDEIVGKYNFSLEISRPEKGLQKTQGYKRRMRKLYDACRRKALPVVRDQGGLYHFSRRALSKAWGEIFVLAGDRRIVLCTSGNLQKILLGTMSPEQRKRISLIVDQKMSTPIKWLDFSRDCRIKMKSAECCQYEKEDFHIAFFSTGKEVEDNIAEIYEKAGPSAKVLALSAYMDARSQWGGHEKWRRLLMTSTQEMDWRIYSMLFILKKQMELEVSGGIYEEYCLVEIVRVYLAIKDFENAFKYMEKYVERGYGHFDFAAMEKDIKEFLADIKARLAEDKRRNVIIRWYDAVRYDEWESMPYLYQMSKEGLRFENAYTVMPYTSATMRTMLTGKYLMNDRIYEIEKFDENTCGLLKDLNDQGYRFCIVDSGHYTKNYDKKYVTNKSLPFHYSVYPLLEWVGIGEILESDPRQKMCVLIHELPETHPPCTGGDATVCNSFDALVSGTRLQNRYWTSGMKTQIAESRKYVDNVFRFYKEMESENTVDIYMSDHGKFGHYGTNEHTTDYENVHICLAINGKDIKPDLEKGIFSILNFRQLVRYAIHPTEIARKGCISEYAVIQELPVYAVSAARLFVSMQYDLEGLMQTTGIITDRDMLQEFVTGRRRYYLLEDLDEDRSGEPEYSERIKYLHDLHKTKIIDVFHDDFFSASIMLYRRCGIEELPEGEFCRLD